MSAPDLRRILVIRLTALGDVLLATPAVRALREAHPRARIDWLTQAAYAPLLEGLPFVDQVLRYERSRDRGVAGTLRLFRTLRARGYDAVVDLQRKPRTAIIAAASGAGVRTAAHRRTFRGLLAAGMGRDRPLRGPHQTVRYASAVAPLGAGQGVPGPLQIGLSPAVRAEAEAEVDKLLGGPRQPMVALAPGAAHATKRWSPLRFAEVGSQLAAGGRDLVLVGGPADAAELDELRAGLGALPAIDARWLGLPALAVLLSRCAVVLSNDSGPVHLAQAVGTPVVDVFGPTEPLRWAPRGPRARVVTLQLSCSPCTNHGGARCPLGHHACMRDLPVGPVLEAARALLEGRSFDAAPAGPPGDHRPGPAGRAAPGEAAEETPR
ncbi:MAG: lipopolysaccharide heptosyltransferase II [Myxococcales bacterium]